MRPNTLRQSVGLVDRLCSDDEMLHYFLETESSRQSLERYAFELSRQVDESVKATRQAEMTAQGKSDFLAMMSHEMRTPLNGIIGMTSFLESKHLDERERECVEVIRRSGETLLAIIDDVLDFSKIEAGRLTLENADFDVARAVLDVDVPGAHRHLDAVVELDDDLARQDEPEVDAVGLDEAAALVELAVNRARRP